MSKEAIEKYKPTFLMLFNTLLSSLGYSKTFPLEVFSGMKSISLFIALIASATGSILGLKSFKHDWIILLLVSLGIIPAVYFYSAILSLGGAFTSEMLLALFCYFYVYFAGFFVLTHFERVILAWLTEIKGNVSSKDAK